MRALAVVMSLLIAAGCVQRADHSTLAATIERDEAKARANRRAASLPPIAVPPWKQWRFAGTRDGEHVVVHVTADGQRHRYTLPQGQFVMPADLAYTDDETRWIPLNLVPRVRADGSADLDFTRMSSNEIDALHSLPR